MNCKDEHPELVALLRFCIYFHLTMEIKQMPINMMTIDLQHLTAIHQEPVHGSRWNESEMRSALTWGSLEPMSWANFHRRSYNYSMKFLGSFFNLGSLFLNDPFFRVLCETRFLQQGFFLQNPPFRLLDELLPNFVTPLKRLPRSSHESVRCSSTGWCFLEGPPPFAATTKAGNVEKSTGASVKIGQDRHGQVAKWQ